MLIQQKSGNLNAHPTGKTIDWVELEWYEANKRILRKRTKAGREVSMKFLKENQRLTQGDILYEDNETIIAVGIRACDAIVIRPAGIFETAAICYEIGNKHLPLFFQDEELLVAWEAPLFNLMLSLGYDTRKEQRKLINPLTTSVSPHMHTANESLFSRIMKLSASANE